MNLRSSFQGDLAQDMKKKWYFLVNGRGKTRTLAKKNEETLKTKGNNIFLLSLVNYVVH